MRRVIAYATPRRHDGGYGIGVELSGNGQAQPFLVKDKSRLELGIEAIRRRHIDPREVAELVEVLLQLRYAADLAASLCVQQFREIVPRGVVGFGGGYYS